MLSHNRSRPPCADEVIAALARLLPVIRALLVSDLKAAQRSDATAESMAEVLICYPGARIGPGLFLSRGVGVVIGATAAIGENVCLHHGVTLGEIDLDDASPTARRGPRHPIIEDSVTIHAGANIRGRITIGAGSIIGGNVWLTRSVPPGSAVTQASHAVSTIHSLD